MNVKRLMKTLLVLKQFDPDTIAKHIKPEKDRLAYNKKKQEAIEEIFCNIQHEISDIRTRLAPSQDVDEEAERLNLITENIDKMISSRMRGFHFDDVKSDLDEKVDKISINIFIFKK